MSSQSPASVLYSSDGYELASIPGAIIPTGTRAILVDGTDGTHARTLLTDALGRLQVVGAGTAGSQSGGVITIQGDPSGTPVPVSGTVAVSSVGGTVTVAGTVTSNQGAPNTLTNAWPVEITDGTNVLGTSSHPVNITGSVTTSKSSTGTITSVSGSVTSITLLASNANRISATIFNDAPSGNILYIALAASSSTAAYTVKLWPGSYWELPVDYTGTISGIWTAATGNALVTELT